MTARGVLVDRVGDQLLAGAALPDDQDRRPRRGDHLDLPVHPLHRGGAANEAAEGGHVDDAGAELEVLLLELPRLENRSDLQAKLLDVLDRLEEELVRSLFHRLDRERHRSVRRDHQEPDPRIDVPRFREHVHPVLSGHHQVGDDERHIARPAQLLEPRVRIAERRDTVAGTRQEAPEAVLVRRIVLDEDDVVLVERRHFRGSPASRQSSCCSSMTRTRRARAFSSFDPASSPATT